MKLVQNMRNKLIQTITQMAEKDPRIMLVVGDLGYSVIEDFKAKYAERFVNAGVAEQNMMGIAAGLALSGNVVFTYSFINFSTFRCLEQIRNDIGYHNANVKIIGIGSGFSYGSLGITHHGVEDVPVMTAIPNMVVISPCDPIEAMLAGKTVVDWDGPCYIRIRRNGEKNIHNEVPAFSIGKGIVIREGSDVTLIGSGWILKNIVDAAKLLEKDGISVRVISMHTVQPIDEDLILQSAHQTGSIISIEDQSTYGLGARVAMILASSPHNTTQFKALGLTKDYNKVVGSEEYHLRKAHLTADGIFQETQKLLRAKN